MTNMEKGKVKKKKRVKGTCETCDNAVYCGDGCHICLESQEGPKCVIDDWDRQKIIFGAAGKSTRNRRKSDGF